jgi:hypothetical protein
MKSSRTNTASVPLAPAEPDRTSTRGRRGGKKIPLFLGSLALRSLRDSGFTLAGALGEPIDNSLESRANQVSIVLEDGITPSGKKGIARIIIADDGLGMEEDVLRRYLQIGFSTRYMSNETIGKYGVGAKLAALSVARRIDVWSRAHTDQPWRHVHLDLDQLTDDAQNRENEEVFIDEPDELPFPEGVSPVQEKGTGTVVVWSTVDRLEEGRRARDTNRLRAEIQQEISRMFRYFLDGGIKIEVNGTSLLPYDPLFLMEGTWSDYVLTQEYGSKELRADGRPELQHFGAEVIADENITIAGSVARLRVTLYPREVLRRRFMGGDELAQKLRIPGSEGVISFVRLNREINYTVVPRIFPSAIREFDRFIGVEVIFRPELDGYFGVRHIKRGVEPEDHLREEIRNRLARYISTARKRLKAVWAEAEGTEGQGEYDSIVRAVADVDRTLPKGRAEGPSGAEAEAAVRQLAEDSGREDPSEQEQYVERVREIPLVLETVSFPGQSFIEIQHLAGQALIRLNTRHKFYRELLGPLKRIADAQEDTLTAEDVGETARRAVEALSLMILAYAKAESMHVDPHEQYDELRDYWGMFLHQMLGKVKDVL